MKTIAATILLIGIGGCVHQSPERAVLAAYKGDKGSIVGDFDKCSEPTAFANTATTRDTVIVRVLQDCVKRIAPVQETTTFSTGDPNSVRVETDYLVVRRSGRWKVERAISGGMSIGL